MALGDVVFEVRTGGSDSNGGGFDSTGSGTDRSQQDASHATLTTASLVNSTTTIIDVDSGDYTATDADVGNVLQITGGTATAGYYIITARSSQQWTMDRSVGTVGQTIVGKMGGALGSPGELSDAMTDDGQFAHVKNGTYTLTTATIGSGGPLSTAVKNLTIQGYTTSRGDILTIADRVSGSIPKMFAAAVTSIGNIVLLNGAANGAGVQTIIGFEIDANDGTGNEGFASSNLDNVETAILCIASNVSVTGNDAFSELLCIACLAVDSYRGFINCHGSSFCESDTSTIQGISGSNDIFRCWAHDSSDDGIAGGAGLVACVSSNNNIGFDGVSLCNNCVAYGNTSHGWEMSSTEEASFIQCIAVNNGGFGFETEGTPSPAILIRCAAQGNTSGDVNAKPGLNFDFISLTSDPFVAAASDDFNLNNTAGGGADLRDAGFISPFVNDTHKEIGALMLAAGGGGGVAQALAY